MDVSEEGGSLDWFSVASEEGPSVVVAFGMRPLLLLFNPIDEREDNDERSAE
jgi:hypothetical protein